MAIETLVTTFMIPVITAIVFSVVRYLPKGIGADGQAFDEDKFLASVALGGALGVAAVVLNIPVTFDWIGIQVVAYGGLLTGLESMIKAGRRYIESKFGVL